MMAAGGAAPPLGFLGDGASRINALASTAAGAGGMGAAPATMAGGGPGALGSGAVDAPFAKRQRMWNAFVMEEQRNGAIRCALT